MTGDTERTDDCPPAGVRDGLRDATIPLATTAPDGGVADLEPVGARLADATVVGLGEATHGTREFFDLKHRLVRHLVADHGVRAVAMEANLPEAMALHDYVVHGEGDARSALDRLHTGCWRVASVLAMVEWLRTFNADRPRADRVELFGVAGHHTHGAVQRLRDHFEAVDPGLLTDLSADLTTVDDGAEPSTDEVEVTAWLAAADRVVETLGSHLAERRGRHVAATAEVAWARARRYVAVIDQVRTKTVALDGFEGDLGDADEYLRRMATEGLPGRTMADNVAWIREHADADTVAVWAHDAHLHREGFTLPDAEVTAPSLGSTLADRLGEDYHALGFSFARGAFLAMRPASGGGLELGPVRVDGPLAGTIDAALDALDEPLAVVDLRAARADDRTADWLAVPRPQFRCGGTYDREDPRDQLVASVYADAFDGICFVAETTPARPLDDTVDGDG